MKQSKYPAPYQLYQNTAHKNRDHRYHRPQQQAPHATDFVSAKPILPAIAQPKILM